MPRSSAAERRAHHGPTLTERKKSNTRPKRDMVELGWVFWPLSSLYCSTAFQFAKCVTVVHLPRFGDVARVAEQCSVRTQQALPRPQTTPFLRDVPLTRQPRRTRQNRISSAMGLNTASGPTVGAQWQRYWERNCKTLREDDTPVRYASGKADGHPDASSGGRRHVPSSTWVPQPSHRQGECCPLARLLTTALSRPRSRL